MTSGLNFPTYRKIDNLRNFKSLDDFNCPIVITEKIHGTNVRFMWSCDHGLVVGGRKRLLYVDEEKTEFDGFGFSDFLRNEVLGDPDSVLRMYENFVFFGEFHGSGIQKGIQYVPDNSKRLRIFDIMNSQGEFMPWNLVNLICNTLNLDVVPELYQGVGLSRITIHEISQEQPSTVALENGVIKEDNTREGVVIKPFTPIVDKYGKPVRAKYKNEKWKERAASIKKKPKTKNMNFEAAIFALEYVTPGRVATIAEHITREGNTRLSFERTGEFIRELRKDIWDENADVKKAKTKEVFKSYETAVVNRGVKLWKEFLAK